VIVEGVCFRLVMFRRGEWRLVAVGWRIDMQMVVDVSVKDECCVYGTASSVVKQVLSCA
jgi:hypothetical protein